MIDPDPFYDGPSGRGEGVVFWILLVMLTIGLVRQRQAPNELPKAPCTAATH